MRSPSLEDFVRVELSRCPSFCADGERLAFLCNRPGTAQVHLTGREGEKAAPARRLSAADGPVYAVRARPGGEQLLYVTDEGGDEHHRLHLLDLDTGASRTLTGEAGVVTNPGHWSGDGALLSFAANRRDRRYFDIYVLDLSRGRVRAVHRDDAMNAAGRFAPDGRGLLVSRPNPALAGDNDLYLVDLAGDAAPRRLTPHGGRARWLEAQFQSERVILARSDEDNEFIGLQRLDLDTGARELLLQPPWDIEALALAPDGRKLAMVLNEDGVSRLEVRRLDAGGRLGAAAPFNAPSGGVISDLAWSPRADALAYAFESPRHPAGIWLSGEEGVGPHRLTRDPLAGLGAGALPEPERLRYRSFDGQPIPALFYAPAAAEHPPPCLVLVHGGPESQSRPAPWGRDAGPAYLLATGQVALFVPNVRGSTGYGKTFSHADDREQRMDAVRDLLAGADWLAASGRVDPRRIGVMGASYGGFMTLAAIAEAPHRWAAAVDLFGVANFVTFLERTGPWRRRHRAAEYGEDPALLHAISPVHKAERIRTPLLVVQGERDVRVPPDESAQIVEAVRRRGGTVEYLSYEREGHGIRRLENRLHLARRLVAFLERHLLSGAHGA